MSDINLIQAACRRAKEQMLERLPTLTEELRISELKVLKGRYFHVSLESEPGIGHASFCYEKQELESYEQKRRQNLLDAIEDFDEDQPTLPEIPSLKPPPGDF